MARKYGSLSWVLKGPHISFHRALLSSVNPDKAMATRFRLLPGNTLKLEENKVIFQSLLTRNCCHVMKKVCSYIALYPVHRIIQNTVHFTPWLVHSSANLTSLGSIQPCCNYCTKNYSFIYEQYDSKPGSLD